MLQTIKFILGQNLVTNLDFLKKTMSKTGSHADALQLIRSVIIISKNLTMYALVKIKVIERVSIGETGGGRSQLTNTWSFSYLLP